MPLWLDIANCKANVSTVSYFCQGANWKFFMMLFSWMVIAIIDEILHPISFFLVQSCGCVWLTRCVILTSLCIVMGKPFRLPSDAFLYTL